MSSLACNDDIALENQREHSKVDQTLRKVASNFSRVKRQMKGHENVTQHNMREKESS